MKATPRSGPRMQIGGGKGVDSLKGELLRAAECTNESCIAMRCGTDGRFRFDILLSFQFVFQQESSQLMELTLAHYDIPVTCSDATAHLVQCEQ